MNFLQILLGTLFLVVCILLVIVVLLQKGRGGGLGSAFGGAGSSAFGTRTGDVFTWVTIVLTGLFLLLAVFTTLTFRPPTGQVQTPKVDRKGPISARTAVRISCGTLGSKIAFTTDGSEPEEKNAKLMRIATANVEPGDTLKFRAYRKKWLPSKLVSIRYEKAIEAPETPLTPATSETQLAPTTQPIEPERIESSPMTTQPVKTPAAKPAA